MPTPLSGRRKARVQIGAARRPRSDDQALVRASALTFEIYQALQALTRSKQPHFRSLPSRFSSRRDHGRNAGAGSAAAAVYRVNAQAVLRAPASARTLATRPTGKSSRV